MNPQPDPQAVSRLFPPPNRSTGLPGLYLDHRLHTRGTPQRPFVYSNFITSLDGRIAIELPGRHSHAVPDAIANARDWRLYQELAGQADLLITSGRFFRQSSVDEAQDILPVGAKPEFDDIRRWRSRNGLAGQPDIVILSQDLEIPPDMLEPYLDRRLMVATGEGVEAARIRRLEEHGVEVLLTGSGTRVEGRRLVETLGALGYRSLYAIAGPAVFHTLLAAGVLDRLYLTIACRLLGGHVIDTLTSGELLSPAQGMQLVELHLDPVEPGGTGQLFGVFESQDGQAVSPPAARTT